ncbi:asparagine synthetase B [Xanthomonas citri pv. mangiferaeindicae]|uniref:asparagine synthetase B family protein n=1 Tax=Xanthomonas citri TaxID=346 RepID=UPI0002552417|nr:asparagine synthetase B [Xanthomonas citri]OOW54221.1 asparagine synthase [Xanthomonas campestris pv. centellae]UDB88178.1 asparagine synthetase B [Xanthomonas citri pv. mangiferaeindicae]UDI79376.1 asparagine synthase [Xanthomonas citri pv. mangiferaeindicae]CCG35229.1 asparagine synthase family protein [Xanthomonas citri pv. mangiferaeindicae LMG 941]
MSDFAGVWRLDGALVAPGDIQRLGQALDARGIGPVRVWQDGPVAIVHRQHVFTPQDADEAMPWVGASGAVLAADVRLAARQELASALEHPANVTLPDGVLLLEALQCWDTAALPRLHGCYALALYRPDRHRLLLARDPIGLRSLFVHRGPHLIAFATRLRALLALPQVPKDLDERALADKLIMDRARPERTIYRAIDRVPMAHAVVLTPEATHCQRWWSPPEAGSLRLRNDAEVEAAAAEVLDRAVADALRARGPVATCLTGGLDSGSITLSAARQQAPSPLLVLTRQPLPATAAATATHYYDESPRARRLAASHPGIDWHLVGDDDADWGEHDPACWWREGAQPVRSPSNMAWFFPLYRFLHARGSQVMLGGELGNAFFSYDGLLRLPQLARQRQWRVLAGQVGALAGSLGLSRRKTVQRYLLRPFAPVALLRLWHGLPAAVWEAQAALQPALAQSLGMQQSLDRSRYRLRLGGGHTSLPTFREWMLGDAGPMDLVNTLRAVSGVDTRYPLADRRVIEFFGSLPLDQFLRDGVSRSLPRRLLAARGAPPEIHANRAVGVQQGDWFARLNAQRDALHAQLSQARTSPLANRVVDLQRLQALLDHWPQDAAAAEARRFEYLQLLASGLQMAGFLAWHERGGA